MARGRKSTTCLSDALARLQLRVGKSEDIQAAIKHEDWNNYVIIANGSHLQHFINGHQTIDVTDEQESKAAKSGVLALQIHVGPPMTVQFKNLRMKSLP